MIRCLLRVQFNRGNELKLSDFHCVSLPFLNSDQLPFRLNANENWLATKTISFG